VGNEERGCDAEYEEIQRVFFESAIGEIPVFGGVLVLGFDLLGQLCKPASSDSLTAKGISTRPRSNSSLDRRRHHPCRPKPRPKSHRYGGEATYILGAGYSTVLHAESVRNDLDQSNLLLYPYSRLDRVPGLALLLYKYAESDR